MRSGLIRHDNVLTAFQGKSVLVGPRSYSCSEIFVTEASSTPTSRPLHPDVLKLGWVSFLTDLSSEMIFSVFAIFFTTFAGATSALLGVIEGLADFSAASLTYWAGWLSDRSGQRKGFVMVGYGMSTLAKLMLLFSSSVVCLGVFRVIERLGKGFRGAPRDAWLSAIATHEARGFAFGVHKALDKAGAVLGPLVAYGVLRWMGESVHTYEVLFAVACVPAVLSMGVLGRLSDVPGTPRPRESLHQSWQELSPSFKKFLWPSAVFSLAYFSVGFILLKAHSLGLGVTQVVLLYALFNITCVLTAPWVGKLGDRVGRHRIVVLGYALYAALNVWLLLAQTQVEMMVVLVIYGVFYAIEESQSKAFIADLEPDRRATAIGVYNGLTGALYLPASLMAGGLWMWSPSLAFGVSAVLSLVAIGVFVRVCATPMLNRS